MCINVVYDIYRNIWRWRFFSYAQVISFDILILVHNHDHLYTVDDMSVVHDYFITFVGDQISITAQALVKCHEFVVIKNDPLSEVFSTHVVHSTTPLLGCSQT